MHLKRGLNFDLFLSGIKVQNQQKAIEFLSDEIASICDVDSNSLKEIFTTQVRERLFEINEGIAVFDAKSSIIKEPVMAIATFDQNIKFGEIDDKGLSVLAIVLSPQSCGPLHLQRLSSVSRILRSPALCSALRDSKNSDEMHVLFMPSQEWMAAA